MTLQELRTRKAELADELRDMLGKADEEKRDLTEDEEKRFTEIEATEIPEVDGEIADAEAKADKMASRREKVAELGKSAVKPNDKRSEHANIIPEKREVNEEKEFRNIGEFFFAVAKAGIDNDVDARLNPSGAEERAGQMMKIGSIGGFAVPEQFLEEMLSVSTQEAVVRPRARVIPAGSPPDSAIKIPKLNQDSGGTNNMWGGFTINHDGESDSITESNTTIDQIELKPKRLTGYMTSSIELLNNWDAASSFLTGLMGDAINAAEDNDFLNGNGVNRALGIFNSSAPINLARDTASQISYNDIISMLARLLMRGESPVWVASQSTLPQLANVRDTGNNNLWIHSIQPGIPNTLAGYPVIWNERSPQLGTKGDIMLANLNNYIIKDGTGLSVAVSEHARFQNAEIAFRVMKMVDGQPWLDGPIVPENGGDSLSPFVVLDTP